MLVFSTTIKIIALIGYVVLAFFTFTSRTETRIRRLFFVYLFGMIYWQFTALMVNFSQSALAATRWYKLLLGGSGIYSILFFPFTRAFLGIKTQKTMTYLSYVTCIATVVLGLTGSVISEIRMGQGGIYIPVFNNLVVLPVAMGYFFWGSGVFNLIRGLIRTRSPFQRNRITYPLVGAAALIFGTSLNFTPLQDFPVDSFFSLMNAALIGYAVIKYKLMDIRVILTRGLFYSLLTGSVVGIYILSVLTSERVLMSYFGYSSPVSNIIAILILAFAFLPLRNGIQKLLNRLFFREKSDYQQVLERFSRAAAAVLNVKELLTLILNTIAQTIKPDKTSIMLLNEEKNEYLIERHYGLAPELIQHISLKRNNLLIRRLKERGLPLLRAEMKINPNFITLLEAGSPLFDKLDKSLIVPILLKDRLLGTLNLGQKQAGLIYSNEDLRFLITLANQTATALDNASAYQEIERRLSEQTLLLVLSETFRRPMGFDEIMGLVVRILTNFLKIEYCLILYYEGDAGCKSYASEGLSQAVQEAIKLQCRQVTDDSSALSSNQIFLHWPINQGSNPLGALSSRDRVIIGSSHYLLLKQGDQVLGILVMPQRIGGRTVDPGETDLLRAIRAIVSQGMMLRRTIVDLENIKSYNENILSSMDNMGDTLMVIDLDGRVRTINNATCQLLDYREEELLERDVGIIATEDDSVFRGWRFQKLIKEGSITNYEMTYKTRGGELIPMLFSGSVMRDEQGIIEGIVCFARDITTLKQAERLREQEVLLKEIHHRVKNNLQVISSLLYLQSRSIKDQKTLNMFMESRNRVRSMALIHEKLYQSKDLEGVNFAEYLRDLVNNLFRSYQINASNIKLKMDTEDLFLEIDTAIPCGLIINELVSNALKHAFSSGKGGEIRIGLHSDNDAPIPLEDGNTGVGKKITLRVSDNGNGFPENLDFRQTESLGLKLVTTLTEQLGGTIELDRSAGTEFTVTFTEQKVEGRSDPG